jgi:hypothetical protein
MKSLMKTVREFFAASSNRAGDERDADPREELRAWLRAHPEHEEEIRLGKEEIRAGRSRRVSRRGAKSS